MKTMNCVLLGYGTVGQNVERLCRGIDGLEMKGVFVRPAKAREQYFSADGKALVSRQDVQIVFECLNGLEPANTLIRTALEHGKNVISSNKAVLSTYLPEYIKLADKYGGSIQIEASVAGGIPLIDGILKLSAAEELKGFEGILNGTCNYILSSMEENGTSFTDALRSAQELGFAEVDPTNDVEGRDVWYKTLLVSSLYTKSPVTTLPDPIGISSIGIDEIALAKKHHKKIRHLAILKNESGSFSALIAPVFLNASDYLSSVGQNYNAQKIEASSFGSLGYYGPGAGGSPTAQAMIADAINLLNGTVRRISLDQHATFCKDGIREDWIVRTCKNLDSVKNADSTYFEEDSLWLIKDRDLSLVEEIQAIDPSAMLAVWRK